MRKTGKELFQFLIGTWNTTNEYGKSLIHLSENGTFETSITADNTVVQVSNAIANFMGANFKGQWSVNNDLVIVELDSSSAGMLAPILAIRKIFYGDVSRQSVRIITANKVALKNLESGEEYSYFRV